MALLDWSMSLIGYPAHRRSGARVVGATHMSTHAALKVAEAMGLYTGWIATVGPSAQLDGLGDEEPEWVALAEIFVERRVAYTEGMVSGAIIFAAAVPADGRPPHDRDLRAWAEERGKPWIEVVDNEITCFGGLDQAGEEAVLRWFLCQRPLDLPWADTRLDEAASARLRSRLFKDGWTRNLSLVKPGRKSTIDLWAGVHARCLLEHAGFPTPGEAGGGVRATLKDGLWKVDELGGDCPLDGQRGRVAPPLGA